MSGCRRTQPGRVSEREENGTSATLPNTDPMVSRKTDFEHGETFFEFLKKARDSQHPWNEFYQRARVPRSVQERLHGLEGRWNFLVLCEDWCGDGANILPYLARAVEASPELDLRVLRRDEHPELMDAHLTNGNRAIPVVMILDGEYREVAWWGPRPAPLQDLFLREIKPLPKEERYPRVRAWYARDRGRTILEEIFREIPSPVLEENP